jgi:hypothetical protein
MVFPFSQIRFKYSFRITFFYKISIYLEKTDKLTTPRRSKLTTSGRSKLTT